MSTAVAGTPADHRPAPAWVRWTVRGLLAAALLAAAVVVGRLVSQWRTTLGWLSADGRLESQVMWHPDQIAWSVAALVAGLGLGWALVSSFRRRLRRRLRVSRSTPRRPLRLWPSPGRAPSRPSRPARG